MAMVGRTEIIFLKYIEIKFIHSEVHNVEQSYEISLYDYINVRSANVRNEIRIQTFAYKLFSMNFILTKHLHMNYV